MRLNQALSGLLLGTSLAVACGGQSQSHGDSDDDSSSGGVSGTGAGPTGGTAGSITTGGVSGTSFGGTSFGGTSSGGVSVGGSAGASGSSGSAGAGGICSLPLEAGMCDAYIPSFGFSQADGHCIPFVYGGCDGNDNRFATLADCEAKCGGSLSECPPELPTPMSRCMNGQICTYDFGNCLCAPAGQYNCGRIDPACGALQVDDDTAEVVIAAYQECTCANGAWQCQFKNFGGPP